MIQRSHAEGGMDIHDDADEVGLGGVVRGVDMTDVGVGEKDTVDEADEPNRFDEFAALASSVTDGELDDDAVDAALSVVGAAADGDGANPALASALAAGGRDRRGGRRQSPRRHSDGRDDDSLIERIDTAANDAFWIARIATAATRRAAGYSVWSGLRTGVRMARAAGTTRSFDDFVAEYERIAFEEIDDADDRATDGGSLLRRRHKNKDRTNGEPKDSYEEMLHLRERGTRLLELSADVENDELLHPAFPHILDQLAPDEARILRYLATEGPQPAVDIRDVGWLPIGSELVGAGMSMLGTDAGCRYEDRIQAYLNNLERLGLIWFSNEPVDEIKRYQLVEAQPDVEEARKSCKRASVVRRTIHLTPFGVDFCRVCFPISVNPDNVSKVYKVPSNRVNVNGDGWGDSFEGDHGHEGHEGYETTVPDGIKNPHNNERRGW